VYVDNSLLVDKTISWESLHTLLPPFTTTIFTALLDFVPDYPGEPVPERYNQSGFAEARYSDWQWHKLGFASSPRQITMPVTPPLSFFTYRMLFMISQSEDSWLNSNECRKKC